ncbi:MAG: LppX_LprAFG lipoprotein [Pseudonocardiaceae bacterium]
MPRWGFLLVVAVLLGACGNGTGGAALPEGAGLLAGSAAAMRTVLSARVTLDIEGDLLPKAPIKSAEGLLTKDGAARGTASVDLGRQFLNVDFVILGEDLYLKGPTGDFRKTSASSTFLAYDPRVILDPNRGVAAVLAGGTDATTEAREEVDGVDSYRLRATFTGPTLGAFVPDTSQEIVGQVWVATEGSRLVQARLPITPATVVTFRFSDYDTPADITAPI